jgi:hypothetical protein
MELNLHANATTTRKSRAYIQRSKKSAEPLAAELGSARPQSIAGAKKSVVAPGAPSSTMPTAAPSSPSPCTTTIELASNASDTRLQSRLSPIVRDQTLSQGSEAGR